MLGIIFDEEDDNNLDIASAGVNDEDVEDEVFYEVVDDTDDDVDYDVENNVDSFYIDDIYKVSWWYCFVGVDDNIDEISR